MSVKWYVIRAISGKENKIKTYLEREIVRKKLHNPFPPRKTLKLLLGIVSPDFTKSSTS